MKIAIMVYRFPPRGLGGGTEIEVYKMAKHLTERGHEVHVVSSREKGLSSESMEEYYYVHRGRVFSKPVIGFTSYLVNAFRIIKKVDPDLIHVQSVSLGLVAFIIKKLLKTPYLVWAQGSDIYLPSKFYKRFYRLIIKEANTFMAQTNHEKKSLQEFYDREIEIISPGIDLESFSNLPREEKRRQLNIQEDEKVIIFVGTLRPVKAVEYLIQAMEIVTKKEPKAKLLLLGDGEQRENLETLCSNLKLTDFIHFLGKVPNDQVPQYMASADLFVLPSLSEGFPVVIVEAMASGLPIITTIVTGLPEIVLNGENGLLVEPRNSADLAEKITLLLGDDKLRVKIAHNNKQKAANYSWENIIDRLEEQFQKVLASS